MAASCEEPLAQVPRQSFSQTYSAASPPRQSLLPNHGATPSPDQHSATSTVANYLPSFDCTTVIAPSLTRPNYSLPLSSGNRDSPLIMNPNPFIESESGLSLAASAATPVVLSSSSLPGLFASGSNIPRLPSPSEAQNETVNTPFSSVNPTGSVEVVESPAGEWIPHLKIANNNRRFTPNGRGMTINTVKAVATNRNFTFKLTVTDNATGECFMISVGSASSTAKETDDEINRYYPMGSIIYQHTIGGIREVLIPLDIMNWLSPSAGSVDEIKWEGWEPNDATMVAVTINDVTQLIGVVQITIKL